MPTSERPILIVDDDHDLRLTLAEQLGLEGEFTAVEAATLQEAEALLSAADARFDLVILDITCRMATAATSAPRCASLATRCRSSC